jgi:hypothetical protein
MGIEQDHALPAWEIMNVIQLDRTVQFGDLLTILTVIFALIGGLISLNRFRRTVKQSTATLQSAHYSELDRFYAEIMRTAIEHPHLREPRYVVPDEQYLLDDYVAYDDPDSAKRIQYDTYAYTVWNFLEAIHDRCADDKDLRDTWVPVIDAENDLHRGWFLHQMRREWLKEQAQGAAYRSTHKFCLGFRIFILEHQWRESDWTYRKKFSTKARFSRADAVLSET